MTGGKARILVWLGAAVIVAGAILTASLIRSGQSLIHSEIFWEPWERLDDAPWLLPDLRDAEVIIPKGPVSNRDNARIVGGPADEFPTLTFTFDTNAQRLRGEDIGPKRPGVPRIVVIGGSVSFGWGVQDDETWPVQLERRLAELGHEVEVINGGMPGVWSTTSLMWCQRVAPDFEPDVIVWARRPHDTHVMPFDDYVSEVHACQQALELPLLLLVLPVCSFDPLLTYWEEHDDAIMEQLAKRGMKGISTTTAFREAQQGRGHLLTVEGNHYVALNQETGQVLLNVPIPPAVPPGEGPQDFWAPTHEGARGGGEGGLGQPEDQIQRPAWVAPDLPQPIYDLFLQNPSMNEVLFVDQGHPDPEGQRLLARLVADEVVPMLGERGE